MLSAGFKVIFVYNHYYPPAMLREHLQISNTDWVQFRVFLYQTYLINPEITFHYQNIQIAQTNYSWLNSQHSLAADNYVNPSAYISIRKTQILLFNSHGIWYSRLAGKPVRFLASDRYSYHFRSKGSKVF